MERNDFIEEFLRKIEDGHESVLDITTGADGHKTIRFGNRKLQPEQPEQPILLRSPRRGHIFHDAQAFKTYLAANGDDSTIVLANSTDLVMSAVLSEKEKTGFEIIHLKPTVHPMFEPWRHLLDSPTMDVNDFAIMMMKHRRTVSEPDGREMALLFSQIRAESKVTIQRGAGKESINGVMVETKIAGSDTTSGLVEIPEMITINSPLFIGGQSYKIEIDLLVTVKRDDNVNVTATSSQVDVVMIEEFERMLKEISDGSDFVVGLGSVEHHEWKTVK